MFSFINSTMSSATSRFLTFEIGRGDKDKLKNYIYITPEYLRHLYNVTDALLDPFKDFIKIEETTN